MSNSDVPIIIRASTYINEWRETRSVSNDYEGEYKLIFLMNKRTVLAEPIHYIWNIWRQEMEDRPELLGFPIEYSDLMPEGEIAVRGELTAKTHYITGRIEYEWIGGDALFVVRKMIGRTDIPTEGELISIGPYILKTMQYDPLKNVFLFFRQRKLESDIFGT